MQLRSLIMIIEIDILKGLLSKEDVIRYNHMIQKIIIEISDDDYFLEFFGNLPESDRNDILQVLVDSMIDYD